MKTSHLHLRARLLDGTALTKHGTLQRTELHRKYGNSFQGKRIIVFLAANPRYVSDRGTLRNIFSRKPVEVQKRGTGVRLRSRTDELRRPGVIAVRHSCCGAQTEVSLKRLHTKRASALNSYFLTAERSLGQLQCY